MRAPAVLLAIPLTVGCAAGLTIGESAPEFFTICAAASALLALLGAVAALASGTDTVAECTVCLVAGAFVVGLSFGADAAVRAYRSPLFVWFTVHRSDTGPLVLRGQLREDAALTQTGVSLVVDVREIDPCRPTSHAAAS